MNPMQQVQGRAELAKLLPADCVGVELGVAEGEFSERLLQGHPTLRLYSIDRWTDHHDEAQMRRALARLRRYGPRSKVIRASFANALRHFADGSLDFIYIDGYAHKGQENGKTLEDWWPKLRSGGMFAGHDYDEVNWPATFASVNAFLARHAAEGVPPRPNTTTDDTFPSWWIIKP